MEEDRLGGRLSVSPRSELEEARLHVARCELLDDLLVR
jgi:hypothetical protein